MAQTNPEQRRVDRTERLLKLLERKPMRTERYRAIAAMLLEAERAGAEQAQEACAVWLESLAHDDDGMALLLFELAAALRRKPFT